MFPEVVYASLLSNRNLKLLLLFVSFRKLMSPQGARYCFARKFNDLTISVLSEVFAQRLCHPGQSHGKSS